MNTTTTYYTQSDAIDELCEQYGVRLEGLNKAEKMALRTTISYYIMHKEIVQYRLGFYDLFDAFNDTTAGWVEVENLHKACSIISLLKDAELERLIQALSAQIFTHNIDNNA